jgi:AcrR family transcriptional regulator
MSISPERLEARRRQLVDAAHALIRENGDAGFSMAQLAAKAGVSPATPYNLIGPKAEVLRLVVQDVYEGFTARLARRPPAAPLAHLLGAVDEVVDYYTKDPGFYAGLYRTAQGADRAVIGSLMFSQGRSLWSGFVAAAVEAGELERFVQVELLTDVLLRMMSITSEFWLSSGWSPGRFHAEMAHAARLVLCSLATAEAGTRLSREIEALQARIESAEESYAHHSSSRHQPVGPRRLAG